MIQMVSCRNTEEPARYNVLFIAVDDLRPEIGAYGNSLVKTPHIDRLASTAILFDKHYVTVPTCGASRYNLLTGKLPATRKHLQNSAFESFSAGEAEKEAPESMVHHFRRNGYYTVGIGKISHSPDGLVYGYDESPEGAKPELPYSWDEFHFNAGKWGTGWNAFFGYSDGSNRQGAKNQVKPYEIADVEDTDYPDGLIAEQAVEKLKELSRNSRPFFLGVGFFKPHLPFTAPKKYWDLYAREDIPLSPVPGLPENVNMASLQKMGEFNRYERGEEQAALEKPLSDDYARLLRHAYFASVSYVDAQIGKVLDELEKQGLAQNTIVVLWGDHGWHLGDHRVWGKHTLFDISLRSPLIISVPDQTTKMIRNEQVVSSVDIYPTLLELCGLPPDVQLDGHSLVSLIRDRKDSAHLNLAYSYFNNGISMTNGRYRLNRYFRNEEPLIELFDHANDPLEVRNVAAEYPDVVESLMKDWEKGNTGLYDR